MYLAIATRFAKGTLASALCADMEFFAAKKRNQGIRVSFYHRAHQGRRKDHKAWVEGKRGRFDLSYLWYKDNHSHPKIAPIFV